MTATGADRVGPSAVTGGPLGLDVESLATCVQCGLCLPHCPTWRVTGDEALSPRGRIAVMRSVELDGAPVDETVVDAFATCVQCRGCEPACPCGVPFGRLIEETRARLVEQGRLVPRWQRPAFAVLGHHRLLLALSSLAAVAQRLRLVPSRRLGLPRLPVRRSRLVASGDPRRDEGAVWLFTGCVMDAWQREVHRAVQTVIEAAGVTVRPTGDLAPCCGALHAHAGLTAGTRRLARRAVARLDGEAPVLVDSAGCGAHLKDYAHVLASTPSAEAGAALARRVVDVHEWLAERVDALPRVEPLPVRVAVQDPCHLRHVQKVHPAVRRVLAPFVAELVELDDEGLCCGAGGAYSVFEPDLARRIRERKLAAVERAGADLVVSANPGCALHLAAAGVAVRHPLELVAEALAAGSA
ncbi:MAG: (Fe-S)-binding protein [Actinomyces sp.]|nr:MAG: (Fe-S)-binding protein [Actinomyces sp.]